MLLRPVIPWLWAALQPYRHHPGMPHIKLLRERTNDAGGLQVSKKGKRSRSNINHIII